MIDLLIQMFGPTLANKFFSSSDELTIGDVAKGLTKVSEDASRNQQATQQQKKTVERVEKQLQTIANADAQQSKAIGDIYHQLQGLAPHNLNPQLDEIRDWMRRHVESEEQTLRQLAQKQLYWNVALACTAGIALLFSILCLAK